MTKQYMDDTLILIPNGQIKIVKNRLSSAKAANYNPSTPKILLKMFGLMVLASLLYIPMIDQALQVRIYHESALVTLPL